MNAQIKLVILWLLLIIGMILHFNYHIGEIFYGIDIVKPGANGKVPNSVFIIRTLFYHLPVIWLLLLIYVNTKWMKFTLFSISALYVLSHLGHLAGELRSEEKDPSQISLLSLVFIISCLLAVEHFKYWKKHETV